MEYRAMGIKNSAGKYFDTSSYSNIFCEKLSDKPQLNMLIINLLRFPIRRGSVAKGFFKLKWSLSGFLFENHAKV